jgi:hypothetical protein
MTGATSEDVPTVRGGGDGANQGVAPSQAKVRHGTYAGWNWHQRNDVPVCSDCKEAARQYMTKWRQTHPIGAAADRRRLRIRNRALSRLAALHPVQFQALIVEEDRKDRAAR